MTSQLADDDDLDARVVLDAERPGGVYEPPPPDPPAWQYDLGGEG